LQDRKFCRYAVGALFNYYHWLDNQPPLLASGSCVWGENSHRRMYKQPSRNASSGQIINKMKDLSNASTVEVGAESESQRVDNFLLRICKRRQRRRSICR